MSKELDNYVKAFEIAPLTTFYKIVFWWQL